MKWDWKSIRENEDSTAACASLWCLLKQKHFNFLKQSLPSCVSSTSLALWGQVSFYQDSGTWAEGLFGERAQLIDFLSSPCCCCGKLLWILENSCWGSFVPQVYEKKRTQQQAASKKKPWPSNIVEMQFHQLLYASASPFRSHNGRLFLPHLVGSPGTMIMEEWQQVI